MAGWPGLRALAGREPAFRNNAKRRFTPSMRQRISIGALYAEAVEQLMEINPALGLPGKNPFVLDPLLAEETPTLLAQLSSMP